MEQVALAEPFSIANSMPVTPPVSYGAGEGRVEARLAPCHIGLSHRYGTSPEN